MHPSLQPYYDFLHSKIKLADCTGFEVSEDDLPGILKPHQRDICRWAIKGGRRAIFARFGLGKTFMQLCIGDAVVKHTDKPFLIGMPLGVRQEFKLDAEKLGLHIFFVGDMADVIAKEERGSNLDNSRIYITNYEKIRMGKFDASYFGGVSFDEAAILRGLDTQTADYILNNFMQVPYRYVATATPSPNEFTELLNYAHFLGIMDRGQALTRFFQRDSTKAGHLTLFPHKEKEFWLWVHSWGIFITKPSDLGYSDEGYDLPPLHVHWHKVSVADRGIMTDRDGQIEMMPRPEGSLIDAAREKRISIDARVAKMKDIIDNDVPGTSYIIWHHLEAERHAIEKAIPEVNSVYGSQDMEEREEYLVGFGAGRYQYLSTKPEIAGEGGNYQRFCHKAIYLGINDKFKDIIQSVHRIYRFMQFYECDVHFIYTDGEERVKERFLDKWERYKEQERYMTDIIRTYGLNNTDIAADLKRTIGVERKEISGQNYKCIRNDNVLELHETPSNSIHMHLTSIPFGDQYEYSESYHDMGHNYGNEEFFKQLDFSTPHMYRTLMPGRIAAIHVKDRIRYSYQNGVGFTSLEDFSGQTVAHFVRHGFHLMGKITITTDVVQENNQTYRLGWSEQCKDGTKMGVGLPEYVLLFRKPPTDQSKAYADIPVSKSKDEYTRAKWQLDAHAYWKSNGNRLFDPEELRSLDLSQLGKLWKYKQLNELYSYEEHLQLCEALDSIGKLSATFMSLPLHSNHPEVWTDVSRMRTLNTTQRLKKKEKHVCPLQFDIVERLIERYTMKGEIVCDIFGGIMTVPYIAVKKGRYGMGMELNELYWDDGWKYCRDAEELRNVPTLF